MILNKVNATPNPENYYLSIIKRSLRINKINRKNFLLKN